MLRKIGAAVALSVCVSLVAPPAFPQTVDVRILGAGIYSCGAWNKARQDAATSPNDAGSVVVAGLYLQWIEGYLTGMQQSVPGLPQGVRSTDADGIAAWMDTYCAAHPTENIAHASERLVVTLKQQGLEP